MIRRSHLGEGLRLGGISLVTANTQHSGVEFFGRDGGRIIGVLDQRTMAGFAIDVRVPAVPFLFQNVAVTALAGLMSGEIHRPGSQLGQGISAKVSVLSKTFRNQDAAQDKKEEKAKAKHRG